MGKIIAYLNGGLGNQMFQYATARALALKNGVGVVVDDWSGFVRDTQYQRHYELGALPIQARTAGLLERLPIWFYRLQHRKDRVTDLVIRKHWYGQFFNETKLSHLPQLDQAIVDKPVWLVGYWQSHLYFEEYAAQIRAELMPPSARQEKFLNMAEQVRKTESIALGIRLYEESKDPSAHARDGQIKTVHEIKQAVDRMRSHHPNAQFFIFCTHRSSMIDQLDLPVNSVSVTHDDGYEGTIERLWLLSQCRHHILTNSTFYWWGAWLSAGLYSSEAQHIMAADNYINSDSIPSDWETF